jgi:hypothetical protein
VGGHRSDDVVSLILTVFPHDRGQGLEQGPVFVLLECGSGTVEELAISSDDLAPDRRPWVAFEPSPDLFAQPAKYMLRWASRTTLFVRAVWGQPAEKALADEARINYVIRLKLLVD